MRAVGLSGLIAITIAAVPLMSGCGGEEGDGGVIPIGQIPPPADNPPADNPPPDSPIISPTVPTNFQVSSASLTEVTLTWEAATDNAIVAGYKIYRDGVEITETVDNEYVDLEVMPLRTYEYQVAAVDSQDNLSSLSAGINANAKGPSYFIGTDGVDTVDCSGGTRANPWLTLSAVKQNDCIIPGDTIYILPGVYSDGDALFEGPQNDHFIFSGEADFPIAIAADPEANDNFPVVFRGSFFLSGQWGVIKGIEFDGNGEQPVQIGGSHITLLENYVHGREEDVDFSNTSDPSSSYDCIRIFAGQSVQVNDIRIIDNEIAHCVEDAIDVVGAKNILYRGNHIYHSRVMQVKGGTENILIEQNHIHNMSSGINGSSMGCTTGYCGSPVQPTLPISERFVAKNITIRNNLIYDIQNWNSVGAYGWKNAEIYNNTFYQTAKQVLYLWSGGFDFFDSFAEQYCAVEVCEPCNYFAEDCWHIEFPAENVKFRNNIIHTPGIYSVRAKTAALQGFEASNNLYFHATNPILFFIDHTELSLSEFPYEIMSYEVDPMLSDVENSDFQLQSGSFAIDSGMELGNTNDFNNDLRDDLPDIGAYEYQLEQ